MALCSPAEAQQAKKVSRIGYLSLGSPSSASPYREAFLQGLRNLGYVEGKNILVEYRYAEGKAERLLDLAAELVRLKVHVIVVGAGMRLQLRRKQLALSPSSLVPRVIQ